jgi:glyoxylase-like metal-dependent hydrolase (beta-lactamase superfamily II)
MDDVSGRLGIPGGEHRRPAGGARRPCTAHRRRVRPALLGARSSVPNRAIYGGSLLDNLAELGRSPQEIGAVAFTHLHPDHVGWAWRCVPGSDRCAFAHADFLVATPEWDRRDLLGAEVATALAPRVRTVTDGQEIFPGVRVRVSAGHTYGHAEYIVTSGTQRLIAFGDSMHSPIQVGHPDWSCVYDHDGARAADHRRQARRRAPGPRHDRLRQPLRRRRVRPGPSASRRPDLATRRRMSRRRSRTSSVLMKRGHGVRNPLVAGNG